MLRFLVRCFSLHVFTSLHTLLLVCLKFSSIRFCNLQTIRILIHFAVVITQPIASYYQWAFRIISHVRDQVHTVFWCGHIKWKYNFCLSSTDNIDLPPNSRDYALLWIDIPDARAVVMEVKTCKASKSISIITIMLAYVVHLNLKLKFIIPVHLQRRLTRRRGTLTLLSAAWLVRNQFETFVNALFFRWHVWYYSTIFSSCTTVRIDICYLCTYHN